MTGKLIDASGSPLSRPTPLALLRAGATFAPRPLLAGFAAMLMRSLWRTHPRLRANLAALEPATIHILPTDLPYGFALTVGSEPFLLKVLEKHSSGADASVAASVATLVDLLEGRIDSDTLFFRRDLLVSGNTAAIVGLRNVLDRDELNLRDETAAAFGAMGRPSRGVARILDRLLDGLGARLAAMHRTLHPPCPNSGPDVHSGLEHCRTEIAALTARLGRMEARQNRRDGNIS